MKLVSEVLEAGDLGELLSVLGNLAAEAKDLREANGEVAVSSYEVYLNAPVKVALFEEELGDGSKVYNVYVDDGSVAMKVA